MIAAKKMRRRSRSMSRAEMEPEDLDLVPPADVETPEELPADPEAEEQKKTEPSSESADDEEIFAVQNASLGILDIGERQLEALNGEFLTDVTILVGDEAIKCHKVIVSLTSLTLAAILVGKEEVRLPDVNPLHFRLLLEIIYSGRTRQPQDVEMLMKVGQLAHMWQVFAAQTFCASSLAKQMDTKNLWQILDFANHVGDDQLKEACLEMIINAAGTVLHTDDFLKCSFATLKAILAQNTLCSVTELELFKAFTTWVNVNKPDPRSLSSALKLIRFRLFSAQEFANVCPTGLLSAEDERDILRSCATGNNLMPEGFSDSKLPRRDKVQIKAVRIAASTQQQGRKVLQTSSNTVSTTLVFSMNKDVLVLGVKLRACRSNIPNGVLYEEDVAVSLQQKIPNSGTVASTTFHGPVKQGDMITMELKPPHKMIAGTIHTLQVKYRQGPVNLAYELCQPDNISCGSGLRLCTLGEALTPPGLHLLMVADTVNSAV